MACSRSSARRSPTPSTASGPSASRRQISGPVLEAATLDLERRGLPAIGIDVAVESGEVVAGVIGAAPRWEYAAIGSPTSRAVAATTG